MVEDRMDGGVCIGGLFDEPDVVIVTLFSKAGPDRGALFLDDGPLVGNGFGRAYIADELFNC